MSEVKGCCGTYCKECSFKEEYDCKGCEEMLGKVFWGECDIYKCSNEKNLEHCGNCADFPCEMLSNMIKNGHNPNRMKNLLTWRDTH